MTTVVANSAARKSAKEKKANPSKAASMPNTTSNTNETDSLGNSAEEFGRKNDKFQPTAEQLRLASLMNDKKEDSELKRKIEQVCELTGANREDASIALYDCDNDVHKAVEMILDGDTLDSEWQSTGKKKNKAKGQGGGGLAVPESGANSGLTNGSKKFDKTQRSNAKTANNSVGGASATGANGNNALGGKSQRSGGAGVGATVPTAAPSVGGGAANKTLGVKKNGNYINNNNNRDAKRIDGQIEGAELAEEDIFAKASGAAVGGTTGSGLGSDSRRVANFNNRRGVGTRGRGAPRGRGGGGPGGLSRNAGPRTFNTNRPGAPGASAPAGVALSDPFPNSIDTWTSPSEQAKAVTDDLNTMTVGNWSDIAAASEDWNEDDWTNAPVETKVFTPSTKPGQEEESKLVNSNATTTSMASYMATNKTNEPQQPTMSAIISGNIKRQQQEQQQQHQSRQPPPPQQQQHHHHQQQQSQAQSASAGQTLLQQIQQTHKLNQYPLSQYSKQATESIKSLVGLNSNSMLPNDITLDIKQTQQQQVATGVNQNRLNKVQPQSRTSKIPDSAVEMPADQMTNLSVCFGSLEFGPNNSFTIGGNDSSLFDSVGAKKPEAGKNLNMLSDASAAAGGNPNYRQASQQQQAPNVAGLKSNMMQSNVIPQRLNDSIIASDHRNDAANNSNKGMNANAYKSGNAMDSRKEYINSYKAYQSNDNAPSSYTNYPSSVQSNNSYYSNSAQMPLFSNSNVVSQSLMGNSGGLAYGNAGGGGGYANQSKLRADLDGTNSSIQQNSQTQQQMIPQQQQQASVGGGNKSAYDGSNVSSAGKNVHNVPPGVAAAAAAAAAQQQQQAPVLSASYMMGNPAMPIAAYAPYPTFDPFQTSRDHGYSALNTAAAAAAAAYATQDGKFSRAQESESGMLPVSSQAAGAVQTATQAHSQQQHYYPPGYGFYFGFPPQAPLFGAATHQALYQVAQPQQASQTGAASAFTKGAGANYGSHSYNAGYDSLGSSVVAPQAQDYVSKNYQQMQQQQHKPMGGGGAGGAGSASDLSGAGQQSLYNKPHQMNKNYENKNFQNSQQQQQFNMSNTASQSAASMQQSYGGASAYMMQPQTMHHSLSGSAAGDVSGQQSAAGQQRNMAQAHKNAGTASAGGYKFGGWN